MIGKDLADCARVYHTLQTLSGTGFSLPMAFAHLSETERKGERKHYRHLGLECQNGKRLSVSLEEIGLAPFDTQLISLAEKTGQMESVFQYLSTYYRSQHETYRQIRTALVRPLSTIAVGLFTAPLVALVTKSISVIQYLQLTLAPALVIAAALLFIYESFLYTLRSRAADRIWFSVFSQFTLTSKLLKLVSLERFFLAFQFAVKCGNGIPIALESGGIATNDPALKGAVHQMEQVASQAGLAKAFEEAKLLNSTQLNYLRTGELSGNIEFMCKQICTDLKASLDLETSKFRRFILIVGFGLSTAYATFVILGGYSAIGMIP